jgi:ubiquinol-cytochrome c reductase cytochrome b subunit/menaquinol-cytochrome c reductase cytochrome b/c subunit
MSRGLDQRRAEFQRYKKDVKQRGKPFYPFSMFHDTVMSLFVVSLIVAMSVIWKFTAVEGADPEEASTSGLFGRLYDDKADPGTTSFTPRPDWYFYFLFYLLRILAWPDSVVLGTVIVPTMLMVLLLALPFLDVRRERRPLRRPVAMVAAVVTVISMGTLSYLGATAKEPGGDITVVEDWAKTQGFAGNTDAVAGATIFAKVGCQNCHTYLGSGATNLGAPDLSDIGATSNRGVQGFADYVANPAEFGNRSMPAFADLGEDNLRRLGTFLQESKGPQ